jgi:hypothetical protein
MASASIESIMRHKYLFFIAIVVALAIIPACGKNGGRVKVYPVQGKVLAHGTPAEGALVLFYLASNDSTKPRMPIPNATTDSEGVFKLTSYQNNDGAPEGEYKVSIVWPEAAPTGAHEAASPRDRLAGRYSNPQKSNLSAKVEKGGGEIPPFELQ